MRIHLLTGLLSRAWPESFRLILLVWVVSSLAACGADRSSSFERVFYAGISTNVSQLEPDTSASTVFSLDEGQSGGAGFTLGVDVSAKLAAELTYADLGSATLTPAATVDYQATGASILYYPWGEARLPEYRFGFTGFVRGGVSLMTHDSDVQLDAEDNVQVLAGLGVDYLVTDRFAIRAEADFHDVDARAFHVGLVYRFGSQSYVDPQYAPQGPTVQTPSVQAPQQRPTIVRPAPQTPAVPQARQPVPLPDNAPQQQRPLIVQPLPRQPLAPNGSGLVPEPRVRLVNGEISGVRFAAGSARLDENAFRILDSLAAQLKQQPSTRVELQVHTNGAPGSRPALNLSRARALVVGRLLLSRGVDQNQLAARAFGANQPRVSGSQTGNERIELRILNR